MEARASKTTHQDVGVLSNERRIALVAAGAEEERINVVHQIRILLVQIIVLIISVQETARIVGRVVRQETVLRRLVEEGLLRFLSKIAMGVITIRVERYA